MRKLLLIATLLCSAIYAISFFGSAIAQEGDSATSPPANPCEIPEARQFDFWVGEWIGHSYYVDTSGDTVKYVVHNSITKELDDCVIMENFTGGPVAGLNGISVSTFDSHTEQWRQTWVDNQRGYLDFEGGFADGVMDLRRSFTRNDTTITQRMRWLDIEPNQFTWYWERSLDGGQQWQLLWEIRYVREEM